MMKNLIDYQFQGLGFENLQDFLDSTFHSKIFGTIMLMSTVFGTIATVLEDYTGLTPVVWIAFIVLTFIETMTGIKVSRRRGYKFKSRRFGRMIVKLFVYGTFIGILHTFQTQLKIPTIFGAEVNIYEWLYFIVLNMIIIQMVISVLENLGKLGFGETNIITRAIWSKLNKWFDIEDDGTNNDTE